MDVLNGVAEAERASRPAAHGASGAVAAAAAVAAGAGALHVYPRAPDGQESGRDDV